MDIPFSRAVTHILTLFVAGATVLLLLHTPNFSMGLLGLSCFYLALVLVRDYVVKLDLQRRSGTMLMLVQFILTIVISLWSESYFAQVYLFILIGEFTLYHTRNQAILFTVVSYISIMAAVLVYRRMPPWGELYLMFPRVIDYLAIFGMSIMAKTALQQKKQLAEDNEQLRLASIELELKAKLQERTRISREIHDSVGHTLTSALAGLQTAEYAIRKNHVDLALEMITRTRMSIQSGLNDVRTSVHLLRENNDADPFTPGLLTLIRDTEAQTQVQITYEIEPETPELPPKVDLTIYRALQEGLTNGIRHGGSTRFRFSLTYQAGMLRFRLSDNGKAPERIVYGFGLQAMKERVGDAGGRMRIAPKADYRGVELEIEIPLQAGSFAE